MGMAVELVAGILATALLAFTTAALWVGFLALVGERFGRCPRCRRLGVTASGRHHPLGCPSSHREHLEQLAASWFGGFHLRHH